MGGGEADARVVFGVRELDVLIGLLAERGYRVIGPTVRDGVIVHEEIASADELPRGRRDVQEAGGYRLERRDDGALFGHTVGPHSWRARLHPPRLKLWQGRRDADGAIVVETPRGAPRPEAFIGVRGCELRAIAVQDRVFLSEAHRDEDYAARRARAFVVAVDCVEAGGNCFCTSMGGDPEARGAHDIALTELANDGEHRFVARAGSEAGTELLAELATREATEADRLAAERGVEHARAGMGHRVDAEGVKETLQTNPEHPRWQEVAERCLGCANCTLVCPTCFCSSVEDTGDLAGSRVERWRRDDSCFHLDFSYIHGGSVRVSTASRYRQWLTHKFANWFDQFGSSGCVGCGRCITWCPVGIDVTEELAALARPAEAVALTGAGADAETGDDVEPGSATIAATAGRPGAGTGTRAGATGGVVRENEEGGA